MNRLVAVWASLSSPDTPEIRAAAKDHASWRLNLLAAIIGPILIIGLIIAGSLQLGDEGVTPMLIWPLGFLGAVVAFCAWRWRVWWSTRGRGPGRHRR